ncbi:hypothetical protein [Megasphaera sp.]|uniref:hypothetical protein n=1 Tax=Megasphaera sp. TaxID=2023260 RepID=UPI0027BA9805|nr:hypothetical protein [Megasphaera sp.]
MKIGFLFGAGAEVPYNMPTGGTFALDIFRQDVSSAKSEFKEMRNHIDSTTAYATEWLPQKYDDNNIFVFGKSVFENIIKDTVEHNREKIINSLKHLDELSQRVIRHLELKLPKADIDQSFENILGRPVDNVSVAQDIKLKDQFGGGNELFSSHYFSGLLLMYKDKIAPEYKNDLGKIIVSLLQLLLGALGENLARQINDSPFSKKNDDIDLFDDMGELFQLNYSFAGVDGLRYLFERREILSSDYSDSEIVIMFAEELLEGVFADVLDYKTLIDSNWHYLYCPKSEWSKFCKISIFLLTVRNYIKQKCQNIDEAAKGYYDDLRNCSEMDVQVTAIATTNYTNLIKEKTPEDFQDKIYFLNGYTEQWYDPYINKIGTQQELDSREKHFRVPLLFTQSGTKPMTSIFMSKAYVSVYDNFYDSDVICSIGFGFNSDDEHINGIIRELIGLGKKLVIVAPEGNKDCKEIAKDIARKLKLIKSDSIRVILVDKQRESQNCLWLKKIKDMLSD